MKKYQLIIQRASTHETTFMLVEFRSPKTSMREIEIRDTFIKAITEWVRNTKEGEEAWALSCADFNIGDLTHYDATESLIERLKLNNIYNLVLTPITNSHYMKHWVYDTVLVDEHGLQET